MDWNIIEGKWKELKGKAREEWGKLTNDELEEVGGRKDRLVGKLQQKYGYASDEAHRRVNEWAKRIDAKQEDAKQQYEAAKTSVVSWWEQRRWVLIVGAIMLLLGLCFLRRALRK
jgi:uncharacterized protein YjbJ (UPF0337 family)